MNIPYDMQKIDLFLDTLSVQENKANKLGYFVQHSRQFLRDSVKLKRIQEEAKEIPLLEKI